MAKGDGIIHKQHFVPRAYLKGFSADVKGVFFFTLLLAKVVRLLFL